LEKLRSLDAQAKVIMITGESNVKVAVAAMKVGAYDYLSKPIGLKELQLVVEKAAR